MTEPVVTEGAPAPEPKPEPVVSPPTQAAPAIPAPAPAKPNPVEITLSNEALKERLAESAGAATAKLLKELGVKSPDDLKAALKSLEDIKLSQLSEKERLEKTIADLKPKAERHDTVQGMLAKLVEGQFNDLPEAARKAIDSIANGDPDKRLELMGVFKASGLLEKPAPVAAPIATPEAPKPGVPAPVSATPSPAPAPGGATTKFNEWKAMEARSAMLGDLFYQNNMVEIERSRPSA